MQGAGLVDRSPRAHFDEQRMDKLARTLLVKFELWAIGWRR